MLPRHVSPSPLSAFFSSRPTVFGAAVAATAPIQSAPDPGRWPRNCGSTRDALQTLYYSVDVYDYFPALICDAVACLDLNNAMPADSASAALLAVQAEAVLKSLDIPLGSVPFAPAGEPVSWSIPGEGKDPPMPVVLARGKDGLWRFDAKTVEAIPIIYRVVTARQKDLLADRAALRENYTDARSTMKRFMSDAYTGNFVAGAASGST